jgi:hypothetical protein
MTRSEIHTAARQLARTPRGRNAIRRLLAWLEDTQDLDLWGLDLDEIDKARVLTLIGAGWGREYLEARDAMRAAIEVAV